MTSADDSRQEDAGGFLAGLTVGAVVGAGLAYLLKNQATRPLAEDLKQKARQLLAALETAETSSASILANIEQKIINPTPPTGSEPSAGLSEVVASKKSSSKTPRRFFHRRTSK